MRDFVVKDFERFLEISDNLETPFKFYQRIGKESFRAWVWLRTALLSFEGILDKETEERLRKHGFVEAEERETKKILLSDLL